MNISEYMIYDIFYNDLNEYVVISANITSYNIQIKINDFLIPTKKLKCGHGHSTVYLLENQPYQEEIELYLSDGKQIKTKVNRYPSYEGEIIMSTCVKNEDNYIIQWINYYKMLGVKRFIIYDNKNGDNSKFHSYFVPSKDKQSNLSNLLKKFIESGEVILIDWPFDLKFQMTQQTHSIHAFKKSKWIGLFDVDEYVNPKIEPYSLDLLFDNILEKTNRKYDQIGGLMLQSKFFNNPEKNPEKDYQFLNCYNCGEILNGSYEKIFVNPKNVLNFSCHRITNGLSSILVPDQWLSINHYFFLNKTDRGQNKLENTDDSIKIHVNRLLNKLEV
jgi:hypothetical protein